MLEGGWTIISFRNGHPLLRGEKHGLEAGVECEWLDRNVGMVEVNELIRLCKPAPALVMFVTLTRLSRKAYWKFKQWGNRKGVAVDVAYGM
jgi:hypothetical protein